MSSFHGRNAHEIAMGSGLMVAWLGELLIAKSVVTREEMATVAQCAEESALTTRTVNAGGAAVVIQEIAKRWEAAPPAKP